MHGRPLGVNTVTILRHRIRNRLNLNPKRLSCPEITRVTSARAASRPHCHPVRHPWQGRPPASRCAEVLWEQGIWDIQKISATDHASCNLRRMSPRCSNWSSLVRPGQSKSQKATGSSIFWRLVSSLHSHRAACTPNAPEMMPLSP